MRDDRKKSQAAAEDDRRIAILRPHLDGNAPLARVASNAGVPLRTERRWLARYCAHGPAGLAQ